MIEPMRILDAAVQELDAAQKRLDVPFRTWVWRHLYCQFGRHTFQGVFHPYCERCGISKVGFPKFLFFWCCAWSGFNLGFFVWSGTVWRWLNLTSALFMLLLAWTARPQRFRFDRR